MMDIELTHEEKKAIAALKRLAKTWPKSLWLFSASGSLCVMRKGEDGTTVHDSIFGLVDQDYVVDHINGIDNDGGDW